MADADDGARALEVLDEIDLLVVCRALYTPQVGAVIARAKSLGKRVLYDIDDLVFDDRYTHLVMERSPSLSRSRACSSGFR